MKKTHPIIAVPLKFGLVGAGIAILLFLLLYFLGKNPLIIYGNFDFSFLLIPVFIFFSIKEFRDYKNNRELLFWQGMSVGFINYFVIALVSALFIYIFLSFVDLELVSGYVADRMQIMNEMKGEMVKQMGEDVFTRTYAELGNTTAYVIALDDFLKKIVIGLFLTIIISVLLRRSNEVKS